MRFRILLAVLLSGAAISSATGQTGTTTTGTTGATNGGGFTLGAATGQNNFQLAEQEGSPVINTGAATGSSLASTNALGRYYANPLYQGRAGATGNDAPGGFGTAISGNATGGATNRGVGTSFGGRTTTTGATGATGLTGGNRTTTGTAGIGGATGGNRVGGFGTTGNLGGFGGNTGGFGNTGGLGGARSNQSTAGTGQIVRPQAQVSYTTSLQFTAPAVVPAAVQADVRSQFERSSMLSSGRGIEVAIDGNTVVLRGRVKDKDEARTAEGMARLTPGVRKVKNELKY